jgi:hydrogenase nickel incorporation protein HypB
MKPPAIGLTSLPAGRAAERNRQALESAKVLCIDVVGGPGCGKTTLLERTIERLMPQVHVGVISGEPWSSSPRLRDADGDGGGCGERVVRVPVGGAPCIEPEQVSGALRQLDLPWLDLLFIENVGSLTAPAEKRDLGQQLIVTVFSVAGGDDKARKHPDLVEVSDAIVLNKMDLTPVVPFDLESFRNDVADIKPSVRVFEVSAFSGRGMGDWLAWLRRQVCKPRGRGNDASHWFG